MTGRRRETRFELRGAEGVLRVLRNVVVQRSDSNELVAISSEAGLPGEFVTIHMVSETGVETRVRVVDSRPIVVDGQVRHRLRLSPVDGVVSSTD